MDKYINGTSPRIIPNLTGNVSETKGIDLIGS